MYKILTFLCCFIYIHTQSYGQCDSRFENEISDTYILQKDLVYGSNVNSTGDSVDLYYDLYEPSIESDEERPLVILIHGGGFFDGTKEAAEVRWFCEDLAKRGIVTASISYRLEPDILSLTEPEKMIKAVMRGAEDAKASIRYFRKTIDEGNPYNISNDYIFIGGTSAGAIAALHCVYMDDFDEIPSSFQDWIFELGIDETLEGNSGSAGYSSKVAGVINISGALKTPEFMNNNADIPLLSTHNEIDFTVPYAWGRPYQIPFLPLVAGSYLLNLKMKSLGGYTELYTVYEINHVPHTAVEGGVNELVYNKTLEKMAALFRHVIPCNELPTSVLEDVSTTIEVYPNPTTSYVLINGLKNIENYTFELVNTNGKSFEINDVASNGKIIIPHSLSSGTYLLNAINTSDKTFFTKKVLIQ